MAESLGVLEIALGVDLGELVSGMSKGQQVVAGFVAGVTELAEKAIEAASEAQTAAAQIAGVFGKLAPSVNEFAEAFARSAGRATSDVQGMVSTFGAMIGPMLRNKETAAQMSEGLTEMAVNLSKAAHITADQSIGALQGALSGHGRELQRLGISMDDTALKAQAFHDHLGDYTKLSKGQQEMVAYQLIMAQMGQVTARAAQADGTYAEQMARLNASTKEAAESFGADLLPYAAKMLEVVNGLATGFANMSPAMRQGIEAGVALAAVLGTLSTATVLLDTEFAAAGMEAAEAWLKAMLPLLPLIAAVGAAALSVGYLYAEWKKAGLNIGEVISGIKDTIMDSLGPAISWIGSAWSTMWEGVKDATAGVRDVIFEMIEGTMAGLAKLLNALASTGHADWAASAAQGLTSGINSLEGTRTSMTAANMGNGISNGAGMAWGAAKDAASWAADKTKEAASWAGDKLKEAGGGLADMVKHAFASLSGPAHGGQAPLVAALNASQFTQERGSGQGGGYSGPGSTSSSAEPGFTHAQLGNDDTAGMFAKANAALVLSLQGIVQISGIQNEVFQDQKDALDDAGVDLQEQIQNQDTLTAGILAFDQTATQTFSEAASKMQSTILGGLGQVGSIIQAGIQGASAGGIWGALIAVFMELMQSCQGFSQVLNVLNSSADMVANAFSSFMQQILPMVGSIQNMLAPIMQGISKIFQALAPVFQMLASSVQMCSPIFEALGNILGAVANVLGDVLGPIFKALAPSFATLANVFQVLGIIINAVAGALSAIGQVVGDVLTPIMEVIGYIFQGVGIVVAGIFLGLADAWNGIAAAIAWVANAIIGVINGVIGALNSALGFLGVNIAQMNQLSQSSISIDTTGLQQSLTNIENGNYQLADSQGALTAATDQAAAALTNLPQGYKVALTEYQNMNLGNNTATTGNSSSYSGSSASSGPGINPPAGQGPPAPGDVWVPYVGWMPGQPASAGSSASPWNDAETFGGESYTNSSASNLYGGGNTTSGSQSTSTQPPSNPDVTNAPAGAIGTNPNGSTWYYLSTPGVGFGFTKTQGAPTGPGEWDAPGTPGLYVWTPQSYHQSASKRGGGAASGGAGGGPSPSGAATSTVGGGGGAGETGITINMQNVTIVANDPQSFLTQLKSVVKKQAMGKYGRTLMTTRFSLPGDSR